jgi:hypothetical protein
MTMEPDPGAGDSPTTGRQGATTTAEARQQGNAGQPNPRGEGDHPRETGKGEERTGRPAAMSPRPEGVEISPERSPTGSVAPGGGPSRRWSQEKPYGRRRNPLCGVF